MFRRGELYFETWTWSLRRRLHFLCVVVVVVVVVVLPAAGSLCWSRGVSAGGSVRHTRRQTREEVESSALSTSLHQYKISITRVTGRCWSCRLSARTTPVWPVSCAGYTISGWFTHPGLCLFRLCGRWTLFVDFFLSIPIFFFFFTVYWLLTAEGSEPTCRIKRVTTNTGWGKNLPPP